MTGCPDLAAFEGGTLSVELARHVDTCASCRFVLELIEERAVTGADECSRFEALLAARAEGGLGGAGAGLLERHLAGCETCRALADSLAPSADAAGDHLALPEVDPDAYELGLEVARGGMGRIVAARDRRIGRPVAVKELLNKTAGLAARFEREARVTARLQHPGIVPIYEIGRWPDGTPFYSMRMVDGRTLREAIHGAASLPTRLALLPSVIAATDAVAFAHGKRIIHRDLTPSNILLGAYGETVVIDWGLSKDLAADEAARAGRVDADDGDGANARLTALGSVLGTAGYMPPEQAHAISVDERADVYALGAILYHLLAGQPPYEQKGSDRLLAAVRGGPPSTLRERAPEVPRDLASIVDKAMARDPTARYPSARELSDELRRWSGGRLVAAHAYTRRDRLRRFVRRNRAALVVVLAAAMVLAAGAWASVRRILDSEQGATITARTLLAERGRTELLAGHSLKALAYLGAAYGDERTAALDFLLASALREVDDLAATLDCGGDVQATALSPDGLHVAAACSDVGRIWRLDDYRLAHTFGPEPGGYHWVVYTADGRTVAFVGFDGVARVYDTATGAIVHTLVHRAGVAINRAAFSPDGTRLVTTGADGKAVVWDARTGERLRTIAAGALGFVSVYGQLAPDGRTLLTVTMGGVGTGWDIETGEEIGSLAHGGQVRGGDLSADGALAATCGADRRIVIWDLRARTARLTLAGHTDAIWKCVFSPDSTRLLSTSADGTAKVWDLATGTLLASVDAGDFVYGGAFSPDGRLITTATLEGQVQVWDATTGGLLTSHAFAGRAARFTLDGTRLVAYRAEGRVQVWRRPAGRLRHELAPLPGGEVRALDRDGRRAVIERAGGLELWDTAGGRPLAHAALTGPFALAAGGGRMLAHAPAGIAVIDLTTGATLALLPRAKARVLGLDAAGGRALVGDGAAPPEVIDVASGRTLVTLAGATDGLLSDDGRRALAWRDGVPPEVWSIDRGRPVATLAQAGERVAPVGFSAGGWRVALHGGPDGARTLTVWDTDDGRPVMTVPVAADTARFDPGGSMLTAIGPDGLVRVLRATDGAEVAAFVGDRLTSAQVDARGRLVVATEQRDGAVAVLDVQDGRVLARWPLRAATAFATESQFTISRNQAWWSGDGQAIVTRALDGTVWDADTLPPGSEARVKRALRSLPWRVVRGELQPVRVSVRGRVTRAGAPVARAEVTVSFRDAPASSTRLRWMATGSVTRRRSVLTGEDGRYALHDLPAGDIVLVARSAALGCESAASPRTFAELDRSLELVLDRCDRDLGVHDRVDAAP